MFVGRIFKKKFPKFWRPFFLGRSNWFFELFRRQVFEKTVKKNVFGHFLKNFDKKNRVFFGARSPSKLIYIGAQGAFRKYLGTVGQKWICEKLSKGGPFGSAGGRIPEQRASAPTPPPPPPPLNPPLLFCILDFIDFFATLCLSQGIKIQQMISLLIKKWPFGAFWKLFSEILFNAFSYFQWPYVEVNENRKSKPLLVRERIWHQSIPLLIEAHRLFRRPQENMN